MVRKPDLRWCRLLTCYAAELMTSSLETFELFAELSLALAGFSGVAASLGGRGREFREIEKSRLTAVLQFSAISLGAALTVISLMDAGVNPHQVYASVSLLSGISVLAVGCHQLPLVFRLARDGESSTSKWFLGIAVAYLATLLCLYSWSAIYVRESWPIMIGISLQLMYGLWCFARLLLRPA